MRPKLQQRRTITAISVALVVLSSRAAEPQTTSKAPSAAEQVAAHARTCLKKNVVFPGPVTDFYFEYELMEGRREASLKGTPRSVSRTPGLRLAFAEEMFHSTMKSSAPSFGKCVANLTLTKAAKQTGTVSVHVTVSQADGIEIASKTWTAASTATRQTD